MLFFFKKKTIFKNYFIWMINLKQGVGLEMESLVYIIFFWKVTDHAKLFPLYIIDFLECLSLLKVLGRMGLNATLSRMFKLFYLLVASLSRFAGSPTFIRGEKYSVWQICQQIWKYQTSVKKSVFIRILKKKTLNIKEKD